MIEQILGLIEEKIDGLLEMKQKKNDENQVKKEDKLEENQIKGNKKYYLKNKNIILYNIYFNKYL